MRFVSFAVALAALIVIAPPVHVGAQTAEIVKQAREALEAKRFDDAIVMLEKAVTADPNDAAALAWFGSAQVRKAGAVSVVEAPGWVKKGFNTLDDAVERFPDAFIVYMVRGITALRVPGMFKKTPVAIRDLTTVVGMKEKSPASVPDAVMPSIYLNLGLAYKKAGQTSDARAAWEKGRTLYPSAAETEAIEKELKAL
jgi:tetratricopeptide (TPR) repeat protein